MTNEEKLKKILDKEKLEDLPAILEYVKKYSLERFAIEIQKSKQESESLQKKVSEIVNGGKSS